MRVSIIAAVSDNGVIGANNDLPWHVPGDLKRFKRLTMGHSMILGRVTYDSLRGQPLPGRRLIVVTRQDDFGAKHGEVVQTLDDAIGLVEGEEEVFVGGGAEIYRLALPITHRMYITRIHADFEGDTNFPEVDFDKWRLTWEEHHEPDREDGPSYTFVTYDRRDLG